MISSGLPKRMLTFSPEAIKCACEVIATAVHGNPVAPTQMRAAELILDVSRNPIPDDTDIPELTPEQIDRIFNRRD